MNHKVYLTDKEIAKAVQLYLAFKDFSMSKYSFRTNASYRRVLFESSLDSWLEGVTVSGETKAFTDEQLLQIIKNLTGKEIKGGTNIKK